MLLSHLLCGVLFGGLLSVACLVTGLPLLNVLVAYVVGANVGLVASLGTPTS